MVLLSVSEKIETVEQLKDWMTFHENREKLKAINEVGDKTIKYMAVLAGLDNAPIDTHVRKLLKNAGIKVTLAEAIEIMKKTAEAINIPLPLFNNSIWKYMSLRNNKKEKALEYLTWIRHDGFGKLKVEDVPKK
jgi:endonuclease III